MLFFRHGNIFALHKAMKNLYLVRNSFTALLLFASYSLFSQTTVSNKTSQTHNILYFNPEVFPEIDEIKEPTYTAFFSALSDQLSQRGANKLLRVDYNIAFDDADPALIAEICENNNAHFAVVPKVKYFKVGFGKYVFSNQVIVSLKVYSATGNLLAETSYDTYKKGGRLVGSAENSIKVGTLGALKTINKQLRKKYKADWSTLNQLEIPTYQYSRI